MPLQRAALPRRLIFSFAFSLALVAAGAEPPAAPPPEIVALDQISVVGRGESRATSAITRREVELTAGAAEPVLLLKRLPGLIVHTNDTFGLYEWGLTVRMRGFDLTQIAFDVDGVPMGRNDVKGNRVSRFVDNENLLGVTVSQGSGDVSTPAYSALGGAVHYATSAPAATHGVRFTQTLGSHELARTFLRADTGTLRGGVAAYASASHTRTEHAYGPGDIERDHAEVKIEKTAGAATLMFAYRFNDRFDYDVFSLSLDEYHTLGREHEVLIDHFTGDPDTDAVNYLLWTNGRRDHLVHGRIDLAGPADLRWRFVPYYQHQTGLGTGWQAVGGGVAVDPEFPAGPRRLIGRAEQMKAHRAGLTGRVEWTGARQTLAAGFWLETERNEQIRGGYEVTAAPWIDFTRPVYLIYDRHFATELGQGYVEHESRFLDGRLNLSLAAKALYVDRRFRGVPNTQAYLAGQRFSRASVFKDEFQPQAGATFKLTPAHELFLNYAQNFSVPTLEYHANLNYDPHLRPERSQNLDAGIRFHRGELDLSLSGYVIRYEDRILAILDPADRFSTPEPLLQNVGSVHTSGAEFALAWHPARRWRSGAALAYTDSRFRDNYFDGPTLVRVRDRVTPDTPRWQAQASVDFTGASGFFAGWDTLYLSQRFGTPLNNQAMAGYSVSSARVGYAHPHRIGFVREFRVQLSVDNVFDRSYLAQVDTPGIQESFYYPGAPRTFTASVSLQF